MAQAVLRRRVRRVGSLLILLGVMLLVGTGAVHLGPTATAQAASSTIISVTKHATWDPNLDFQFTLQSVDVDPPVTETFTLRDSPPGWVGQSFYSLPLGTYRISEVIPTGWHATAIFCRDRVSPSPIVATGDLSAGSVTVTLTESLTYIDCEFSNDFIHGTLIVQKITEFGPSMELPTLFDFDPSWSASNFTLTSGDMATFYLAPGEYSVTELAEPGWELTLARCGSEENNPDTDTDPNSITVDLAANQLIECRFINQATQTGRIIVDKVTPEPSDHSFEFDPSWSSGNFTLTAAQDPHDSGALPIGTYSVKEVAESDWQVTDISCTYIPETGAQPVSIGNPNLETGEVTGLELVDDREITCTFTNQQTGEIYVHKTGGPDTGGFDFQVTGGASPIPLNDVAAGGSASPGHIPSGTYGVVEIDDPDDGWSQASGAYCNSNLADVVDGFAPSEFVLHPGEVIDCYFTNTRDTGTMILAKELDDPAGLWEDDGSPTFTLQLNPGAADHVLPDGDALPWESDALVLPTTLAGDTGYSVTEPTLPTDWILQGIVCTDAAGATVEQPVVLGKDQVVTCTVTNERLPSGSLTIVKEASPANDTPFSFTGSQSTGVTCHDTPEGLVCISAIGMLDPFVLTDPSDYYSTLLGAGEYSVTEGALPADWEFGGVSCEGNAQPEVVDVAAQTVDVTVGRDETVICTFHNTGYGFISVQKEVPAGSPYALFTLDPSWGNSFTLAGGEQTVAVKVPAGIHSVAEVGIPPGWSLASATCDDGSAPNAIGVSPGETVTCTFVNQFEDEGGSLTIIKQTTPAGGAGFAFDGTLGAFTLDDGGLQLFEDLVAGSYTVTETPAVGWEFEDVVCTTAPGAAVDYQVADTGVRVNLADGQDVTCVFSNREEGTVGPAGSLTIIKETVPPGGAGFGFDGGALGPFTLDDGGSAAFTDLVAGSYTVAEVAADGWGFSKVECDALDWSAAGQSVTVNLAEGEAAVCTFTNGQLPYTGDSLWLGLLLAGLAGVLAGLGMWVWSLVRTAERA